MHDHGRLGDARRLLQIADELLALERHLDDLERRIEMLRRLAEHAKRILIGCELAGRDRRRIAPDAAGVERVHVKLGELLAAAAGLGRARRPWPRSRARSCSTPRPSDPCRGFSAPPSPFSASSRLMSSNGLSLPARRMNSALTSSSVRSREPLGWSWMFMCSLPALTSRSSFRGTAQSAGPGLDANLECRPGSGSRCDAPGMTAEVYVTSFALVLSSNTVICGGVPAKPSSLQRDTTWS